MSSPRANGVVMIDIRVGLLLVAGLFVGLSGCRDEPSASREDGADERAAEEASAEDAERTYQYSPFGVRLEGSRQFDLVSVKDVGLGQKGTAESERLLEAVAQSIAFELRQAETLEVQARTFYDRRLGDPDHHEYCEAQRLYVDVWRSGDEQWGYSLWSGCSESMKFAWREVPMERQPESGEVDRAVEPIGEGIRKSLVQAKSESCFRRNC